MPFRIFTLVISMLSLVSYGSVMAAEGELQLRSLPKGSFHFEGFVGDRVVSNIHHWLIPAPSANPGMIEMFRVRDREPVPRLVPWAGEFVGKHLISSVQALRMSDDSRLQAATESLIRELISTQADDGYLGPFRKQERLLGHWDLWGHYHCMLGLLMWHERTGDEAALTCVKRAADLVCRTYLDTGKRALDAKSDEMNLSIIHSLGWLYRLTKEDRYLRMMREIEKDWEKAGDYLRTGLNSTEFFQTPRPRWESLHNIQGLVELYRITGDAKYKQAFEHHWRSIARFDMRNSGGFSSGEQATGNPYAPTPIETCCTIAWMAISTDMLALTADPKVADLLELSTLNAWAGAQHPSGRWCTYNTPMDGIREASGHTIVFQSRNGTPELNCCSVNGPRGWGMLSEWAVMQNGNGVTLNWLAPGQHEFEMKDGNRVRLTIEGNYPQGGSITVRVQSSLNKTFNLAIRIPDWVGKADASLDGNTIPILPGSYLNLNQEWGTKKEVKLNLQFGLRFVAGNREARDQASLYWGPLLLAVDQKFNTLDTAKTPAIDLSRLNEARLVQPPSVQFPPLVLLELPGENGEPIRLCDYASAGAHGTHYRSWLPASEALPAPVATQRPRDGERIAQGNVLFKWNTRLREGETALIEVAEDAAFNKILLRTNTTARRELVLPIGEQFISNRGYHWRVITSLGSRSTESVEPAARFVVDSSLPKADEKLFIPNTGPKGELVRASLKDSPRADFGVWKESPGWKSLPGSEGIALNGIDQKLIYQLDSWPEEDYALELSFRIHELPQGRLGQVFSGWTVASDDPLRVVIDNGKLFARMEAGGGYSTPGVSIETNRWYKLRVEKSGASLRLLLDGKERGSAVVPAVITTTSREFGLGGNPRYSGNEHLKVDVRELVFSVE